MQLLALAKLEMLSPAIIIRGVPETTRVDSVIVAVLVPLMVFRLSERLASDVPSTTSVGGFEMGYKMVLNSVIVTVADGAGAICRDGIGEAGKSNDHAKGGDHCRNHPVPEP